MCHFFLCMNSPIDTVACIKVEVSQCHEITWPSNLHKLEKVKEKKVSWKQNEWKAQSGNNYERGTSELGNNEGEQNNKIEWEGEGVGLKDIPAPTFWLPPLRSYTYNGYTTVKIGEKFVIWIKYECSCQVNEFADQKNKPLSIW